MCFVKKLEPVDIKESVDIVNDSVEDFKLQIGTNGGKLLKHSQNEEFEYTLLKSKRIQDKKKCPICGSTFYSNNPRRKYCKNCRTHYNKIETQNIKLSNIQFKKVLKLYEKIILWCVNTYGNSYPQNNTQELYEHCVVNLYLLCLRRLCKNKNIYDFKSYELFPLFRHCCKEINLRGDIGQNLDRVACNRLKTIRDITKEIVSLYNKYGQQDSDDILLDFIQDKKLPMDRIYDVKNLRKQFMVESLVDKDIQCTIVKEELKDVIGQNPKAKEEEKLQVIKSYVPFVKSVKSFYAHGNLGMTKLWNLYAPEIMEILDISPNEVKYGITHGRHKDDVPVGEVRRCPICGKAFINTRANERTCGNPECVRKYAIKSSNDARTKRIQKQKEIQHI